MLTISNATKLLPKPLVATGARSRRCICPLRKLGSAVKSARVAAGSVAPQYPEWTNGVTGSEVIVKSVRENLP